MPGIINFEGFLLAGILLNLTPGTDTMYILGRSMTNGRRAGILSALGISTGSLVHTVFAALGLSVILVESAFAFNLIKYLGAGYLVYMGIKSILEKQENSDALPDGVSKSGNQYYLSGILTNVLNPKVALFYLAFLPQFIDPSNSTPVISLLILGITFTITGTIWCLILATFSSKIKALLSKDNRLSGYLNKITGIVFIALGVKLALREK
ncbi:MAG: LysE family translocator [Bacteroidetes bacterium]|nr:LysE family translocator [Bacteroidota bacterium]